MRERQFRMPAKGNAKREKAEDEQPPFEDYLRLGARILRLHAVFGICEESYNFFSGDRKIQAFRSRGTKRIHSDDFSIFC